MPKTAKQQQAANEYLKTRDRMVFYAPKSEGMKERIQSVLAPKESVNQFILAAVEERIQRLSKPQRKTGGAK
jgi:tRNA G37 N-methylase TrmD